MTDRIDQTVLLLMRSTSQRLGKVLRHLYYARMLKKMGRGCSFGSGVHLFNPQLISLGNNVILDNCCIIQSSIGTEIHIGNNVTVSYGAQVLTGRKNKDDKPRTEKTHQFLPVVLEDSVVIGAGAIVQPGIRVGTYAFVAPGSVVTRDVPPYTLVAGVPAKVIKEFVRGDAA